MHRFIKSNKVITIKQILKTFLCIQKHFKWFRKAFKRSQSLFPSFTYYIPNLLKISISSLISSKCWLIVLWTEHYFQLQCADRCSTPAKICRSGPWKLWACYQHGEKNSRDGETVLNFPGGFNVSCHMGP